MADTRHERIEKLLMERMIEKDYVPNEEEFKRVVDFSLWDEKDYTAADIWLSEDLPVASIPDKLRLGSSGEGGAKEEKPYREGDEPPTAAQEKQPVGGRKPPITAFLILRYPEQVEVVLDLPGLKMDHRASLRDIRDCATMVRDDSATMLTADATAKEMAKHLAVASKGAIQNEVVRMMGRRQQKKH